MIQSLFKINHEKKIGYSLITIKNTSTNEYITIIPELGARLNEAVLGKNNSLFSVLGKIHSNNFRSRDEIFNNAKLFPFANRIKGGSYCFYGKSYQLSLNYNEENNACHGLVYDKFFKMISFQSEVNKANITFEYDYNHEAIGYPFDFKLVLTYELNGNSGVTCKTQITNNSKEKILFSDGWHPFFILDEKINNSLLKLDVNSIILTDDYHIPTGLTKEINSDGAKEISDKFFDTTFYINHKDKIVTELFSPRKDVTLQIWQESGINKYRYINVYTPSDRKSIAIEPMTSNLDAFNNKQNIIYLEPDCSWEASFGFLIK